MSNIVTFYSYKGGVGRTMALANVAMLLAKWGYKTLMVDWDLEAPGLEFYFRDYLNVDEIRLHPGVVELLLSQSRIKSNSVTPGRWNDYVIEVPLHLAAPLHLLTAGNRNPSYFERLRSFDAESFYDDKDGGHFIESLRDEWKQNYDFVLIDSRTGITDIGGICTVQLPDILVLLFTANEQSLKGIMDVAAQANEAREHLPFDRHCLLSLPIPSRFDTTEEYAASQDWLARFARDTSELYFAWLPKGVSRRDFLAVTKIPYISYFSFGEKLPVVEQGTLDPSGLGFAFETLASLVANNLADSELLLNNRSDFVRRASKRYKQTSSNLEVVQGIVNETRKKSLRVQQIGDRVFLPKELQGRLRDSLLRCDEFSSQNRLQSVFTVSSLSHYRYDLPETSSVSERVDLIVDYLLDKGASTDASLPLLSLISVLKDRYDPSDELHNRLTKLQEDLERAINNTEFIGETIEIPFIIAAMISDEAQELFDESVFNHPSVAPNERLQFQSFRSQWYQSAQDNWVEHYGPRRENWKPFSTPHSGEVVETVQSIIEQLNRNNLKHAGLQQIRPSFKSDDFFSEDRNMRLKTWGQLQASGGVLIIDAVSLFHPRFRQKISRSTVTTSTKVATIVMSPETRPLNQAEREIWDLLSVSMESLQTRCELDLDKQVEIGVATNLALRRWLYSILPEQTSLTIGDPIEMTLSNKQFDLRAHADVGGHDLPGTSIRPPDQWTRKKCPNCGRRYSTAKVRKVGERTILSCPYCNAQVG